MALAFQVLWAGRHQPDAWESLCGDYRKRIEPMVRLEERPIRVRSGGDDRARRRAEGRALAAAAPQEGYWVALDRRGEMVDSESLARRVETWRREWPHAVVFFLGSDLGLEPELTERCRWRWSLGPLTLPHALARLVLFEQLYRALSIGAGIQYHRKPF